MAIINVVGRVTRDFELQTSENGNTKYVKFGLADNEWVKGKQETTFYECTVFGADAERLIKAMAGKGSVLNVCGKFRVHEYRTDNGDGELRRSNIISVLSWSYVPGTSGNRNGSSNANGNSSTNGNGGNNSNGTSGTNGANNHVAPNAEHEYPEAYNHNGYDGYEDGVY